MRVPTVLSPSATDEAIFYPTSDGRQLRITHEHWRDKLHYQFELGFAHRDPSDELPTDAVECRFWLADVDGNLWTTRSRFTARLFVSSLVSFSSTSRLVTLDDLGADVANLFDSALLLEDARYSSDDRFYRQLVLGDAVLEVQFHYTSMSFDVAYVEETMSGTALWIRLREGSLFIDGDPVPTICYQMRPHRLWSSNVGLPCEEDGHVYWEDSYLPVPLVFELTDEVAEPNPRVVLL